MPPISPTPRSDPQLRITLKLDPIFIYPTLNDQGAGILHSIADRYQAGEPTDPHTLIMDDTLKILIQKTFSGVAKTHLTAPLPALPPSETGPGNPRQSTSPSLDVSFERCRRCAGEYVFILPQENHDSQGRDARVTIIAGAPRYTDAPSPPYKAMSYVWGPCLQMPLRIPCNHCSHVTCVPVSSVQRFLNLMMLGGPGNTIWLDALSIDQSDEEDVLSNIAIMGTIYKQAQCVSVLLPAEDKAAYECLTYIKKCAMSILTYWPNFVNNGEVILDDPSTGESVKFLAEVCQMFIKNLVNLGEHLDKFIYWSRAWTFQEWALANDLEIAVEGGSEVETCFNLKSLVLAASLLIGRYKLALHQYAEIKLGMDRGFIAPFISHVKALFPDEDLFLSYDEIDPEAVSFQTYFPHFGADQMLGVRSVPPLVRGEDRNETASTTLHPRQDPLARLRTRLILLSSFAGSKRKATYEADLVASWASMCNVSYAYDRNDDFALALRKVTKVLREQGLTIFHFLPDTSGGLLSPSDVFRAYAKEHRHRNATNQAELPGAPIFTGRTDTITHLTSSLLNIGHPTQWDGPADDGLVMNKVVQAQITESLALGDHLDEVLSIFVAKAVYGDVVEPGGMVFWEVQEVAKSSLEQIPAAQRALARLVTVAMPFYRPVASLPPPPYYLNTWAILPIDIPLQDVIVCRESINGTLVLVTERDGTHRILAYLTISDHLSGTFLVQTDENGGIDLTLRIPERAGVGVSAYRQMAVRQLRGSVVLDGRPTMTRQ